MMEPGILNSPLYIEGQGSRGGALCNDGNQHSHSFLELALP